MCSLSHPQIWYDNADVVVTGLKKGVSKTADGSFWEVEVLRTWKSEMPIPTNILVLGRIYGEGASLLYLTRRDGILRVMGCGASLHESFPNYSSRSKWLERISACHCPSYDAQGWYDHADAVVDAKVESIVEKGAERFAHLKIEVFWNPESLPRKLTVRTEDNIHTNCGYPVEQGRGYLLYLRRDETGQFSTDFCSGNLDPSEYSGGADRPQNNRFKWFDNQKSQKNFDSTD